MFITHPFSFLLNLWLIKVFLNQLNISQGDGTRKGNGLCVCNNGYEGENCDQCAKYYFVVLKNDTFTCEKCHKSCKEGCTDSGPKG